MPPLSSKSPNTERKCTEFLVVRGKSIVERLSADDMKKASVISSIQAKLGFDVEETKTINFISGDPEDSCYKFPVIALCSKRRHDPVKLPTSQPRSGPQHDTQPRSTLDLHTSEAPIETSDLDLTVNQLQLRDLLVGGILNLYAVERSEWAESHASGIGKEVLFGLAESWVRHLRHHRSQV